MANLDSDDQTKIMPSLFIKDGQQWRLVVVVVVERDARKEREEKWCVTLR